MKNLRLCFLAMIIGGTTLTGCHKDDDDLRFEPVTTDNPMASDMDRSIDQNFRAYIENTRHIGLSIALIDGAKTSFYNYGETNKGNKTLPTENSLYEIGSITKTFTAEVATKLMLDNNISADTPINHLLPADFKQMSFQGQKIELKHLFDHTSGLPRVPDDFESYEGFEISNPYGNYDYEKLLNFLNNYSLTRVPGTEYEYSNLGYLLLSTIIEYQSDVSLANHIESFITEPLGMNNTHMNMSRIVDSNPNVMGAYDENGIHSRYWTWSIWEGIGGQYSNLVDLERFVRAHFNSFNSNEELKEVIAINTTESYSNELFSVGRAWHIVKSNGNEIINHAGGTGGFGSVVLIEPHKEKAIIVLANNFNSAATLQEISLSLMNDLLK